MQATLRIETRGALFTGAGAKVLQDGVDQLVTEVTMLLLAEVKKYTPQGVYGAQGGLLGSIQADVVGKGTPVVKGIVASNHKYVEPVEKGRAPGKAMPPEGSLLRWLEVKAGLSVDEAKRIEFVVRRSIGRKGFQGAHMFEKALVNNLNRIDALANTRGLTIASELSK